MAGAMGNTKKIGRKRRVAGWMLLALGVIVACAWAASGSFYLTLAYPSKQLTLGSGMLTATRDKPAPSRRKGTGNFGNEEQIIAQKAALWAEEEGRVTIGRLAYNTHPRAWRVSWRAPSQAVVSARWASVASWTEHQNFYLASHWTFLGEECWALTLWSLPLLFWTPATLLLRSGIIARRRAMSNACDKCGYSLAGLTDTTTCTECGKMRPEQKPI